MTHELTFTIPANLWLSANDRRHWADKARRTKTLRSLGWAVACQQGLRGAHLGPTHVTAYIGYPTNGKADPANCGVVKPLIDGLVDAKIWLDDDHTHVIGPTYLRDPATGQRGVHTVRLVLEAGEVTA